MYVSIIFSRPCSAIDLKVFGFSIEAEKLVLSRGDALLDVRICSDEDDVLNEVLIFNWSYLPFD